MFLSKLCSAMDAIDGGARINDKISSGNCATKSFDKALSMEIFSWFVGIFECKISYAAS